jgi:hypothetical protein
VGGCGDELRRDGGDGLRGVAAIPTPPPVSWTAYRDSSRSSSAICLVLCEVITEVLVFEGLWHLSTYSSCRSSDSLPAAR